MARHYWIEHASTVAEGTPLDAFLCRSIMQDRSEALYEECRADYCIMLSAAQLSSASWFFGPLPIQMRQDRSNKYRQITLSVFACGGSSGAQSLRCYFSPRWSDPETSYSDYVDISVPGGTAPAWTSETGWSPPNTWAPDAKSFPAAGDENGILRFAYLTLIWQATASNQYFAGIRINEGVKT